MNTTFNFNRLVLLLKRFFVENKQKELNFWAIVIVVFMFLHNSGSVGMFIIISGFIFAARMFKSFSYTPGGMHYLLIPATHLEKLVSSILLSTVYFLIAILSCYVLGNTFGTHLGNLIFDTQNVVRFQLFEVNDTVKLLDPSYNSAYIDMFLSFAIVQSIFLLGSIYFKRNAVGKTMLSIILFTIVIGIIEVTLLKMNFGTTSLNSNDFNFQLLDFKAMFPGYEVIGQTIKYLTAPFFWVVSYFRLTEKEV